TPAASAGAPRWPALHPLVEWSWSSPAPLATRRQVSAAAGRRRDEGADDGDRPLQRLVLQRPPTRDSMPGAAMGTANAPPASPAILGGRRHHREGPGIAPVVSKRLDVAVVQQHLPAAHPFGENLGKSHPGLF